LSQEQRRLAAILAADIAGYSRLMAANEAGTLAQLRRLRAEVIDPKIAEYQGHVVGSAGDSLLVEFASAVNAVQCAVELQAGLADRNAALPDDRRMAFRMGVNLGDVIAGDGTIHGDGVNIAARLEKLAPPGTVCIGRSIHDQVKSKLAYGYADLGEQRFHNIPEPVHAFRVTGMAPASGSAPAGAGKAASPPADKPSIAVLPFTNMSGDPEQEYFSDGITEDIITELSRFHSLFVIARNSSFVYKGRATNVVEIGRTLGVRYVTEGSVRRAGNRIRVTAQLVDTRTGNHLWAERFDRELEDIFAVQDEVTRRIVTSVAPLLAAESLQMASRKPPEDMQAYDYYLKAKALVEMAQTAAALEEGRELCNRAIQIDPAYARAHACKAFSYIVGIMNLESEDLRERRKLAVQCAEQAVALDPMDSNCQLAAGLQRYFTVAYPWICPPIVVALLLAFLCDNFALERSEPRWLRWAEGAVTGVLVAATTLGASIWFRDLLAHAPKPTTGVNNFASPAVYTAILISIGFAIGLTLGSLVPYAYRKARRIEDSPPLAQPALPMLQAVAANG